jgi:hypothetical protein
MPRRRKVPEMSRSPTASDAPAVHTRAEPHHHARRLAMTTTRRPSFQADARYLNILDAIDATNWAEMDITASQWRAIVQCVPVLRCTPTHDGEGIPILVVKDDYGLMRTFYLKGPKELPSGRGDLTTLIRQEEEET